MRDVVAFVLETRTVRAARCEDVFNVLEGVLENQIPAIRQMLAFPVVLELLEAVEHGIETEIHRTHVQ